MEPNRKQLYRKGDAPRQASAPPPRTNGRPQDPAAARRPAGGLPPRRPVRRDPAHARRVVLLCLAVLALTICAMVGLVSCNAEPKGPQTPDYGEPAGAWQKNEKGFYFNDAGEVIPGAVLKGIDVSKYQGEIDWETAKAAGIDFAILRCGFGSEWNGQGEYRQDDDQWRRNADECTRLGIPFGCYLYSYATTEEQARLEAAHVARLLGLTEPPFDGLDDYTQTPYKLDFPVYYDLEDKAITGLFPDEMARLTEVFFEELGRFGYTGRQGIYASVNWVRGRLDDPAFDPWRDELWIARFHSVLGYTGGYRMWQSTYTAPGADYGVQSETVDIDFVINELRITGIEDASGKAAAPSFTNDTYKNELWLPAKKDRARLVTDQPAAENGGQRVFWSSSDEKVAKVNKKGGVTAVGEGCCTVTATLADGTETVECTVRVGSFTVPVFATGVLRGQSADETLSLADLAALKADTPDAILLDAGGSVHGTVNTSLTGGMDMTSAFSAAGYDLQVFDASDLAFGADRLIADAGTAAGPSLAANLQSGEGVPLFYRSVCWNRNRISNGMNYLVEEAGRNIGFFSLASTGNSAHAADLLAADLSQTAGEQTAALRAQGADVILCIVGPDTDAEPIWNELKSLGVTAVIDGGRTEDAAQAPLPVLGAATDLSGAAKLELVFGADGSVSARTDRVTAQELANRRSRLSETAQAAYDRTEAALQSLADGDASVAAKPLFTFEKNTEVRKTIGFGNYLAQFYEALADGDRDNWPAEAGDLPLTALATATGGPDYGEVTRGALLDCVPGGARVVLVKTGTASVAALIDSGTADRTYTESLRVYDQTGAETLLVADTALLAALDPGDYTVLRDYGDAFWDVRMNLNDRTNNFQEPFLLDEAPSYGAGRNG